MYDVGGKEEEGALIILRAQNHASQINVNKRVSFCARRILSCILDRSNFLQKVTNLT